MSNQNQSNTGTQNESNGAEDPKVVIDPSVLAEAQGAAPEAAADTADTAKVEKTEAMPIAPVASGSAGGNAAPPPADKAGEGDDDPLPINDGKTLKYGLAAAAVLGVIALFGVGFMVVRNSAPATTPTVVLPAPASAPGASPTVPTLPEVRTPAPRIIDATGCRRGQYRLEGNQLVFTNCATLELSEPAR